MSKGFLNTIAVASIISLTLIGTIERAWGTRWRTSVWDSNTHGVIHRRFCDHYSEKHPNAIEDWNEYHTLKPTNGGADQPKWDFLNYEINALLRCRYCDPILPNGRNINTEYQQIVPDDGESRQTLKREKIYKAVIVIASATVAVVAAGYIVSEVMWGIFF